MVSSKDSLDSQKAKLFEEEASAAMSENQKLVQEMNELKSKLATLNQEVEKLRSDLNENRDVLKQAALDIESEMDFSINVGPEPGAAE